MYKILLIISILIILWCFKKIIRNLRYNLTLSKYRKAKSKLDKLLENTEISNAVNNTELRELQKVVKSLEAKLTAMDMLD